MPTTTQPVKLCQWTLLTLERNLALSGGAVLPAGTEVLLLPQTNAGSVVVENGRTLAEVWPPLATALTGYAAELARYADRLTRAETELARLRAWAQQNGYTGD